MNTGDTIDTHHRHCSQLILQRLLPNQCNVQVITDEILDPLQLRRLDFLTGLRDSGAEDASRTNVYAEARSDRQAKDRD